MKAIISFVAPNEAVPANSTVLAQGQLQDVNGNPVPAASVNALTLSLTDDDTGTVVNGVSQTDILNTGRGVLSDAGPLGIGTLQITLAGIEEYIGDTAIIRSGDQQETRTLTVDFTYSGGFGRGAIRILIVALPGL